MPQVASDIIITGARVLFAPLSTTVPAPTLAVDAAWPVGWVDVGYTLEATKVTYKFDTLKVMVQQTMSPVRTRRIKEEVTIETVLAEHTTGNLALALAGESTATAATASVPGYETFTIGGDPDLPLKMVGIEGSYADEDGAQFPIRLICWQATVSDGGTLEYDREKPAGIPLKFDVLADTSKARGQQLFQVIRILEPVTP